MSEFTYKNAGVDLELNQQAMQKLPPLMQRTHRPGVMELTGGFAGLFRLNQQAGDAATKYDDPVLVSGTDGVGTKIKVAIMAEKYDTIGIDLVAMCVNDCLCLGAEPLFFLDYIALPQDNPTLLAELVTGVSEGCVQAGAALLGGETAIMPDIYAAGDFDMAGFCVGVVERERIVDGTQQIKPGDVLIGLQSSGFHSNGYSLIRKLFFEGAGLSIDDEIAVLGQTAGEALLTPTKIYASEIGQILNHFSTQNVIHGMAHITGGGFAENVERILPENCRAVIQRNSWEQPAIYKFTEKLGLIDRAEMERVFNLGIGYVLAISPEVADETLQLLKSTETAAWVIGEITTGTRGVELK